MSWILRWVPRRSTVSGPKVSRLAAIPPGWSAAAAKRIAPERWSRSYEPLRITVRSSVSLEKRCMTGAVVARRAVVVVAGRAIVGVWIERQQGGVAGIGGAARSNPRHAIVDAVVVFEMVETKLELVAGADAPTKRAGRAPLVDARSCAVAVRFGLHEVESHRGVFTGLPVEVGNNAFVVVAAQREVHLVLIDESRFLVDLIHRATGRAASEQHRGRATEHLEAVEIEGVAIVERRVTDAVDEDVAALGERKARRRMSSSPPSAAWKVMPAVFLRASLTVSRLRSSMSLSVTTVTDWGCRAGPACPCRSAFRWHEAFRGRSVPRVAR